MPEPIDSIALIARRSLEGRIRRSKFSSLMKSSGMIKLRSSSWLAFRNRDIVSGLMIDGPPSDLYLTTFILPAFGRNEIVHWSLGRRVVSSDPNESVISEFQTAVRAYQKECLSIQCAADLLSSMLRRPHESNSSIWTIFISYLRLLDYGSAIEYLTPARASRLNIENNKSLEEIWPAVLSQDFDKVQTTFDDWSKSSERIFGNLSDTLDCFGVSSL